MRRLLIAFEIVPEIRQSELVLPAVTAAKRLTTEVVWTINLEGPISTVVRNKLRQV